MHIKHITIRVKNLAQSMQFYQSLTELAVNSNVIELRANNKEGADKASFLLSRNKIVVGNKLINMLYNGIIEVYL